MISPSGTTRNPDERVPSTNHLLIDEHLGEFIAAVERATRLASNDPPSFYGVGQLTGECNACHRGR